MRPLAKLLRRRKLVMSWQGNLMTPMRRRALRREHGHLFLRIAYGDSDRMHELSMRPNPVLQLIERRAALS